MKGLLNISAVLALALPSIARSAPPPATDEPIKVMVVGEYRFDTSKPGVPLSPAEDVLTPANQQSLQKTVAALAGFKPNKVTLETPADWISTHYPDYLHGPLPAVRDERVQLGLRLARATGASVYGIDAAGDFPFGPLQTYANANGFGELLTSQEAVVARHAAEIKRLSTTVSIPAALRYVNNPPRIFEDNTIYRVAMKIGSGSTQPAVDLLSAWQHRNLLMCANLLQLSKPGDRIAVVINGGFAYLLRQCVTETPGYVLVEPNDYIPT